jgi:hypothetical protein
MDVEIEVIYHPGEPPEYFLPDGSGYPGSEATIELLDVRATHWHIDEQTYERSDHWIWLVLDAYAFTWIEQDWESEWRDFCMEELADADRSATG